MEKNVELKEKLMENKSEKLYEKYRDQMDLLEKSVLAKVNGGISPYDVYALGTQLQQFDTFQLMCEESGNTNLLGIIPNIAYDTITAVHGASIIPIIASVQPIEEEQGMVYFKNVRSSDTKGSQTAGDKTVNPRTGTVTPSGYSSNKIAAEQGVQTAGGTVDYSFTLAAKPIRGQTLKLTVESDTTVYGEDVGFAEGGNPNVGRILGAGLSGTVNYTTGVVTVKFAVQPTIAKWIYAEYQQNYELATDIPKMDSYWDYKAVQAHVYALKGTIGLLQSFALKKRFGAGTDEEIAKDLVQEINREIGGDLIRKLYANMQGSHSFDKTAPGANISYFEHKMTYMDELAVAESNMLGNAGRGTITHMIVGKDHAAVIQGLPNFKKVSDGQALGAHVFGMLDGVVVIRVPEVALLGAKEGIAFWKGTSPFEAPIVYSPYMPLMVTGVLPEAPNPLVNMRAAATWAATEVLVENFITEFKIIQTTPSP